MNIEDDDMYWASPHVLVLWGFYQDMRQLKYQSGGLVSVPVTGMTGGV